MFDYANLSRSRSHTNNGEGRVEGEAPIRQGALPVEVEQWTSNRSTSKAFEEQQSMGDLFAHLLHCPQNSIEIQINNYKVIEVI